MKTDLKPRFGLTATAATLRQVFKSILNHLSTLISTNQNPKNSENFDQNLNQSHETNDSRKRVCEDRFSHGFGFVRLPERIFTVLNAFSEFKTSVSIRVHPRLIAAFPLCSFLSAIVPQCGTKEDASSAVKSAFSPSPLLGYRANLLLSFSLAFFAFRRSAIALATVGFLAVNPLFSAPPTWWTTQNVLDTTKTANDYAALNQGQLKSIAKKAITEMNTKLPGGAGTELNALLTSWATPNAARNDFQAVNVGQVKALAKKFYDRLNAVGVTTPYPWSTVTTDDKDYALANIGQVKKAFAFEVGNGIQSMKGMVAAGSQHVLVLKSNGTVWAWGNNVRGALGDGTTVDKRAAVQVQGINGITAVAVGNYYSMALKSDGTVWAWGNNSNGTLGDGTTIDRTTPVQVVGLSGVVSISTDNNLTIVVKSDGTLWQWGSNRPLSQIAGLSGVLSVSQIASNTVIVKNDGTVWTWGSNSNGALGYETGSGSPGTSEPRQVLGLSGVKSTSIGRFAPTGAFTAALKSDGTVWTWGFNAYGQLGDGTTTDRITPVQMIGLNAGSAISAGSRNILVVKSDGTIWGCGDNASQQLRDGTTVNRSLPVRAIGLSGVVAAAVNGETITGAGGYGVALKSDGTAWAWGYLQGHLLIPIVMNFNTTALIQVPNFSVEGVLAPTGLIATAGNTQVTLNWTAVSGATSYIVQRSTINGTAYSDFPGNIVTAPTLTLTNTGLTNGTTYYYVVSAINASGISPQSTQVSATPSLPPAIPATPTGLTATASNAQVTLNWNSVSGAASYKLQRSTTNGSGYVDFTNNTVTAPTVTLTNTGLTNGTTYYYVLTAINAGGSSPQSAQVSATPVAPPVIPATPTGLTASAGNAQVTLNWNSVSGAASYKLQRSTTNGSGYVDFANNTVTAPTVTLTNTGLTNGTTYYYVLTATNTAGTSPQSAQVIATPVAPPVIPATPTGLTATAGNARVTLNWAAVSGAASYKVQRSTTNGSGYVDFANNTVTAPTVTLTNTGLINGTTYYYVLTATNIAGTSPQSAQVSATPQAVATFVDTDGDGLSDLWEQQYFGNLTQTATGDSDADGLNNLQEFLQGRNPTKGVATTPTATVDLELFTVED